MGFLMYQSRTELLHRERGRGLFHLLKYLKKLVYTRALDVKYSLPSVFWRLHDIYGSVAKARQ